MTDASRLPEPTRCYVDRCSRENELMLHVADDPWRGGDYCMGHAREIAVSTPLIMTCECAFCHRARRTLADTNPRILTGPGRWIVTTETSGYVVELDGDGTGSLVRHRHAGEDVAPSAVDTRAAVAVDLRRDGESIPVLWAQTPVVGERWVVLLDLRGDGILTRRQTTIVRSVVRDPLL